MYSCEDRVRAVKLYVKLGKRTAATMHQLGYPTKNSLKRWHREFERSRDLPMGYTRSKPKYSDEQKKLAVDHYLGHGRCMTVTIKALGYPGRDSLATWINELHPEATKCLVGRAGSVPGPALLKRAAVIELCTRQECRSYSPEVVHARDHIRLDSRRGRDPGGWHLVVPLLERRGDEAFGVVWREPTRRPACPTRRRPRSWRSVLDTPRASHWWVSRWAASWLPWCAKPSR